MVGGGVSRALIVDGPFEERHFGPYGNRPFLRTRGGHLACGALGDWLARVPAHRFILRLRGRIDESRAPLSAR